MGKEMEHLDTSDVGSLPIAYSEGKLKLVSGDKVSCGLDYPSYPQFSDLDMNIQFLVPIERLGGELRVDPERGGAELLGEKLEVEGFIPELAGEFALYMGESGLERKIKGKRAPVTGPFTLAAKIGRDLLSSAASKPAVVSSLAETLGSVCRLLTRETGYEAVCIDEPMLSVILSRRRILFGYDKGFISNTLEQVLEGIDGIKMVHICGRLPPIAKEVLLDSKAELLDHEFADYPKNYEAYTREELESYDKKIGLGCVSSVRPEIEDVETIVERIKRGVEQFGPRLLIDPDCGMGSLSGDEAYGSSLEKLRNMVGAARRVKGGEGGEGGLH